ncbi:DUF962 family protein [Schizosaccharomyces japonicus yFS275]|uniref:Glucosamine 6-phosphate N-acetyltransferase n=1 Tax=Schizosaccharomyces japonicus (strain yFS275 / FY16936) TaxID=402676 RepID=B6JVV3_SCHJY|nr:DUF962 family protein [Schizosaccharomyces japonicus yFS275]EEB05504.2 DUF962 family protein [Schizosaccharomyces japonicus yFS275]
MIKPDKLTKSYLFYREYHKQPGNVLVHKIFVPILLHTAFVLLASKDLHINATFGSDGASGHFQCDTTFAIPAFFIYFLYYLRLRVSLALLYLPVFYLLTLGLASFWLSHFEVSLVERLAFRIHIVSWIVQFISHKYSEHRRPALFKNLVQSLMFAPIFVFIETVFSLGMYSHLKSRLHRLERERTGGLQKMEKFLPKADNELFPHEVLHPALSQPEFRRITSRYVIRPLRQTDLTQDYLYLLDVLAAAKEKPSLYHYKDMFYDMKKRYEDTYFIIVAQDHETGVIVGTASLIIEHKFIRGLGTCGHIEDVVVHPQYQGQSLGKTLLTILIDLAKILDCYKVILDCDEENVEFYHKCGLKRAGAQMKLYLKQH